MNILFSKLFNDEEYANFRCYILSKTNAANIHTVNGLLGRILNNNFNAVFSFNIRDYRQYIDRISKRNIAIKQLIGKLTL